MANKYIVPIGVLIAAVLIIAGGFLILNPYQPSSPDTGDNTGENESYVETSESEAQSFMPELKVTEEELKQNADVPLKVGKRYKYGTTAQSTYEDIKCADESKYEEYYRANAGNMGDESNSTEKLPIGCVKENKTSTQNIETEYYVEKTEKTENRDCYVVSVKTKQEIPEEQKSEMSEEDIKNYEAMMEQQKTTFYFDKENGKILKFVTKMGGTEMTLTKDMANAMTNMMGMMAGFPVFSQWMLALDENFRWTQTIEEKGENKYKAEIGYKVIGTEKIDNRECFKVEMTFKDKSQSPEASGIRIDMQIIVWVDKEKRILVKTQTKAEGMMNSETNLISES